MTETDTPIAVPMDEPFAAVHGTVSSIDGPEGLGLDRTMEMNLELNSNADCTKSTSTYMLWWIECVWLLMVVMVVMLKQLVRCLE